jgi:intron-binding protein aquarius
MSFLRSLIDQFFVVLRSIKPADVIASPGLDSAPRQAVNYCERFLELVIDLLAQLPTRRFFHALILDRHFVVRCQISELFRASNNDDGNVKNAAKAPFRLFRKLLESLKFYEDFEIDQKTG